MRERRSPLDKSPARVVHLADDLGVRPCELDDGFWTDPSRAELATGRLLSVFSYEVTWDYQELHPTGDELVYVLDGEVELLLDRGEGEQGQQLTRGEVGVVPAGSWHRVALSAPAALLFITPVPALTEHRACRAG